MEANTGRNIKLAKAMADAQLDAPELAGRVNVEIQKLTEGRPGKCDDRHVRRWLSGQVRWPQEKQRLAIERVFNRSATELGFIPRSKTTTASEEESPVLRRRFLTTTPAAAAAAALTLGAAQRPRNIGRSDVTRLTDRYQQLVSRGDREGGTLGYEKGCIRLGNEIEQLLDGGSCSQRTSGQLYSLAATVYGSAGFAAFDAKRHQQSRNYLDRAARLAQLSRDGATLFQTFNHLAMLARQQNNITEAMAAARAAADIPFTRRSPVFASLAASRMAINAAQLGDIRYAERLLGRAQESFNRGQDAPMPAWAKFYDAAELHGMTAITLMNMGQSQRAEAHLHQAISRLRPGYIRNHAYYTAWIAEAQAGQGELEIACTTASDAHRLMAEAPGSKRTAAALGSARHSIASKRSNHPEIRTWLEETRTWALT